MVEAEIVEETWPVVDNETEIVEATVVVVATALASTVPVTATVVVET